MINESAPMGVSHWFKAKPYLNPSFICEGLDLNATEKPSEIQNLELSENSGSNTKKFAVIRDRSKAFVFRWDKTDKRGDNVLDIEQVKIEDGKPWHEWPETPESKTNPFHHPTPDAEGYFDINIPNIFEGKLKFDIKRYQKNLGMCSYIKKASQNMIDSSSYVVRPTDDKSREMENTTLSKSAILMALLFLLLTFSAPVNAASWKLSYDSPESLVWSLQVYNGKLYAGTASRGSVYVYDGISWNLSYESQASSISDFAVYNGKLYASTALPSLIVYDGTSWSTINDISWTWGLLEVYNNRLYAVGSSSVYEYNGTSWSMSQSDPDVRAESLAVYNGKLYAGSGTNGIIYVYDGTYWNASRNSYVSKWNVSYDSLDSIIQSFVVHDGKLYAGSAERTNIYMYDGNSWSMAYGLQEPTNGIWSLASFDGKLYALIHAGIITYNGTWTEENWVLPCIEGNNRALAVYNNKLYAGTNGGKICELNPASAQPTTAPAQVQTPTATPTLTPSPTATPTPTPTQTPTSISTSTASPTPKQCDGCLYADSSCIPFGTRLGPQYSVIPFNGSVSYCDAAKKAIEPQKNDTSACQNNYECISNYCSNGVCGNLQKELAGTRSLLEQILDFLRKLFGFGPTTVSNSRKS